MRRDDPALEPVSEAASLPWPNDTIIAALKPLVLPRRLERMQTVISQRTEKVLPILEGLADPHNASAVLRSCDAFGIQRIKVIETDQTLRSAPTVTKGADRWLSVDKYGDAAACFRDAQAAGYTIWVASMKGTRTVDETSSVDRIALVFGNEHRGPSETALKFADDSFAIPMLGFVESLNVSVAAAISLHAARGQRPGTLPAPEQEALLARYLLNSVRNAEQAIEQHLRASGTSSL